MLMIGKCLKKYLNSIKLQPQVIAIIFIEITFAIVTLLEVFANTINVTRDITAPADKVWKIISNVEGHGKNIDFTA